MSTPENHDQVQELGGQRNGFSDKLSKSITSGFTTLKSLTPVHVPASQEVKTDGERLNLGPKWSEEEIDIFLKSRFSITETTS